MAWMGRSVNEALDRWVETGLLGPGKAEELRAEAAEARTRLTRRAGQFVLAALGAVALVAAAVVFGGASWAELSRGARVVMIVSGGIAVYVGGLTLAHRTAMENTAVLLQAGGLGVVLAGLGYSESAWPGGTAGAFTVGLLALAVPLALLNTSLRQGVVMTGVHTALSFLYLALGLERSLGLGSDAVVWVLDGVLVLLLAGLWITAGRWSPEARNRGLAALGVSFWVGLVLALYTGAGPLDLRYDGVYAVDAWALMMTAVTLWGIHGAPPAFRRDAFEANLAAMVVVLGVLAMFTAAEAWVLSGEGAAAGAAGVGLAALVYGLRWDTPAVLVTGGLMALLGTWIFALESAGALGGAGALLLSAVLLFWISSRVREDRGRDEGPGSRPPPSEGVEVPASEDGGAGPGDTRPRSG